MIKLGGTGLNQQVAAQSAVQSDSQKQLQQCHFLFHQALDADEAGNKDEAVKLYTQAVELGINAVSVHRNKMLSSEPCYWPVP
jgi:hypothetical protein